MGESIVNFTRIFMIVTGLWKLQLFKDALKQKSYEMYSIGIQTVLLLFGASSTIRLAQLLIEDANSTIIYSTLTINILIYLMTADVFIFLKYRIPYVFEEIVEEELRAMNSDDPEIKQSYLNQTRYYRFTTICQIFGAVSSAIVFVSLNVYNAVNSSFQEQEVFMYQMWLPFDPQKNFVAVVVINVIMLGIAVGYNVASRVIIQTLIIFATAQLKILQLRLRKVFSKDYELKLLIRKHQRLISFVNYMNDSLKNLILMEYLINTVSVAAGLLHIITAATVFETVYSAFHLILLIVQVFLLAWSANEINVQSTNVANAAFDSNWVDQNEQTKKIIHIVIMRAQKPLVLKIGMFRPMNAESAVITMKGAYTYASVMLQKYS